MNTIVFNAFLIIVSLIVLLGTGVESSTIAKREKRAADEKYTTKYDNFDVEGVLASARLVRYYGKCLLDKGACPPEGKFLKDLIPDALSTQCSKCSPIQKKQAGRVLEHLLLYYRELFLELCDKYDKDGSARRKYGIDTNETEDYSDYDEA